MTTFENAMRELLATRFGGVIKKGKHSPDGECCILELASVARGLEWSDDPQLSNCFDIRPINDGAWTTDALRTHQCFGRLYPAIEDSLSWPVNRQRAFVERIAIKTINQIVSALSHIPETARQECASATTREVAASAADIASAANAVLILAVDIWVEAAEFTKGIE